MAISQLSDSGFNGTKYGDIMAGNTWMEPIATQLLGSSQASVTFNNIPQGYTHLQLRGIARCNAGNQIQQMGIQFNGDTGNNYAFHALLGDGGSASSFGTASTNAFYMERLTYSVQTSGVFSAFVIDILDYTNQNKYKTSRVLGGYDNNGGGSYPGRVALGSGLWMNTSPITSLTLINANTGGTFNFVANTRFSLYGLRG